MHFFVRKRRRQHKRQSHAQIGKFSHAGCGRKRQFEQAFYRNNHCRRKRIYGKAAKKCGQIGYLQIQPRRKERQFENGQKVRQKVQNVGYCRKYSRRCQIFYGKILFRRFGRRVCLLILLRQVVCRYLGILFKVLSHSFPPMFRRRTAKKMLPKGSAQHAVTLFSSGLYRRLGNFTRSAQKCVHRLYYRCGISPCPKEYIKFCSDSGCKYLIAYGIVPNKPIVAPVATLVNIVY